MATACAHFNIMPATLLLASVNSMNSNLIGSYTLSIIVSRILYALPAWGGFLTVELKKTESMPFSSALGDLVT